MVPRSAPAYPSVRSGSLTPEAVGFRVTGIQTSELGAETVLFKELMQEQVRTFLSSTRSVHNATQTTGSSFPSQRDAADGCPHVRYSINFKRTSENHSHQA